MACDMHTACWHAAEVIGRSGFVTLEFIGNSSLGKCCSLQMQCYPRSSCFTGLCCAKWEARLLLLGVQTALEDPVNLVQGP